MTELPGPLTVALRPFAVEPAAVLRAIDVRVARPTPALLRLEYALRGDLAGVRTADPAAGDTGGAPGVAGEPPGPTDGLWRHTCMEAFIGCAPAGPYLEFNLAPSGRWAAYRFSGYRAGMAPLTGIRPPRIELHRAPDRLLLAAQLDLPAALAGSGAGLRLGIAAVVEDARGQLSYWAARHAGDQPDFHHPDSFCLEI